MMMSVREKREQRRLRKIDARRQKRLKREEQQRVKKWRKDVRRRQKVQEVLDEFNKNPERRDFYVKLAKMEPLIHLEYQLAQIMELEGLRQFKKSLGEFANEHLIEHDKLPLDTSGTLYLFRAFEYEFYYWKVYEMLERVLVQVLVLFFSEDRMAQICSVCTVLCIGLAISLKYRPFIDPVQDQIDIISRSTHVMNAFLALGTHLHFMNADSLGALLLLVNICCMTLLAILFRVNTWPMAIINFNLRIKDSYVVNFMFTNLVDKRLRVMRKWDSALSFWSTSPGLTTPLGSIPLPDATARTPCYDLMAPCLKKHTFRNRGKHLLLKWDDHLGVKRPIHKQPKRMPSMYHQTKWASYRSLTLAGVRFGKGVSLLHIAMAKPEVETAKWLLDYDVRDELYKVRDMDGNVSMVLWVD
jgi:hypothetical protein